MSEIEDESDVGWVVFSLKGRQYGLPTKHLVQMVVLDKLIKPALSPDHVRGLILVRDLAVPVVDLRRRLGILASDTETRDFLELMAQRKQDHINWLNELYKSVQEERPFTLATDPHKCAFGKWYDAYTTDSTQLAFHLRKFDEPHKQIHGVAARISQLVGEGKKTEAEALIENTRHVELAQMIELFDSTASVLNEGKREVVLVMVLNGERCGFLVDQVLAVRGIPCDQVQPLSGTAGHRDDSSATGIASVDGVNTVLLDINRLLQTKTAA